MTSKNTMKAPTKKPTQTSLTASQNTLGTIHDGALLPRACRFEVWQILLSAAGQQRVVVDAQVSTRGRRPFQTVSVMIGDLLIYCLDLPATRAMATAWQVAAAYAPKTLPAALTPVRRAQHEAGIVLRAQGNPGTHKILGVPAEGHPWGIPAVRVTVGRLTVEAHDLAAVACWNQAWTQALDIATRLWDEPDAFAQAEARDRDLIARYGPTKKPPRP